MKKLLIVIFLLCFITNIAFSQETMKDKKGIIFTLDELNPTEFDGGIGGIWYMKDNLALRGMFDMGFSSTKNGSTTTARAFGFGLDAIKPLHQSYIVPYVGAGTGFSSSHQNTDYEYYKEEVCLIGWLIRGILGCSYRPVKNIEISAEYRLYYKNYKTWNKTETKHTLSSSPQGLAAKSSSKSSVSYFGLSTAPNLIITIYF